MTKIGFIICTFVLGFIVHDLSEEFVPSARAEVAGMDWTTLKMDYDFKTAVRHIVEDCKVNGEDISC